MQTPLAQNRVMELYSFGWRNLGAALREHAWFYIPLAVLGGAFAISALVIAATVWGQIPLVAMASNTGVPEEHAGAFPV